MLPLQVTKFHIMISQVRSDDLRMSIDVDEPFTKEYFEDDNSEEDSEDDDSEESDSEEEAFEENENDEKETPLSNKSKIEKEKKWTFLQHKGPVFPSDYKPLPEEVKFRYDGQVMKLSKDAEEVAGLYARYLYHERTTKPIFNKNFFDDWRKVMDDEEKQIIKEINKCDFREMQDFLIEEEKMVNRTEEKKAQDEKLKKEYGYCVKDGIKEKICHFRIKPPSLFKGRGENTKMGMLKKRVMPEDVIINCSKDSNIPKPPPGHKWMETRHDNTVTWLAKWSNNVTNKTAYMKFHPSSKIQQKRDKQKYEKARELHKHIDKIREDYRKGWEDENVSERQYAVALYLIDELALRVGNKKSEDEADTIGCCSLRVEHVKLKENNVVELNFLAKHSVPYFKEATVDENVYKNLKSFIKDKQDNEVIFDSLSPQKLNDRLNALMPGLTAKVFRTYKASTEFQKLLHELTKPDASLMEKIKSFETALLKIAGLCNHKVTGSLKKCNSTKRSYIDPRIIVAWCKKHNVPIEYVYTKFLRDIFQWAIDEAGPGFILEENDLAEMIANI